MILYINMADIGMRSGFWLMEDLRKIKTFCFPVRNCFGFIEQINTTDQFIVRTYAQLRHDLTYFFCNEEKVVHNIFWLTRELGTQYRILCCHTNWAGIEVTLTHHDATLNYQRCCRKADFIRAEHRSNRNVTTGFHLTVSLYADTTTQAIQYQGLLCLGQAQLPWCTCMFNRRQR